MIQSEPRLGPLTLLWALELKSGEVVTPQAMAEVGETADGRTIWRRGDFEVHCRWRQDDSGTWLGTIGYRNAQEVEAIRFPVATYRGFPASGTLLLPDQYGIVLHRPQSHIHTPSEYTCDAYDPELVAASEMVTFRASAMLAGGNSFLFDFRDPGWYQKRCFYRRTGVSGELVFYGGHLTPLDGKRTCDWELPYECGVTPFAGGWFEAAKLYRRWALTQPRARKKPDPRVREFGCVCWNRGLIADAVPPVLQLSRDCHCPVMLSWYWWHHNPYDTDYPDYWPPREGEAAFRAATARLKEAGCHAQVYLNGMTWDMDGASRWEGGRDAIVVRRDGTPECFPYNLFNHHRLGSICGSSREFQDRLLAQLEHVVASGMPGIYLDMIGNANHRPCYSDRHGHAPGGGDYHFQGYRRLLLELRKRHPELLLSTEDCNEDMMDLVELVIGFHICHERFNFDPDCEQVPAYPAIYHGIMPVYGSYTLPDGIPPYDPSWPPEGRWKNEKDWLALFPDQVFLEFARQIVYGNIPTVANLKIEHCTEPRYREVYDFLCRTVRFYREHADFLFDGEMLPPPEIECETLEVDFMARFIYTHEGEMKTPRCRHPVIFASRWRSPAGGVALVLVNWSRVPAVYHVDGVEGRLPARSYRFLPEHA